MSTVVSGLPPTVAIEQRISSAGAPLHRRRRSRRSTTSCACSTQARPAALPQAAAGRWPRRRRRPSRTRCAPRLPPHAGRPSSRPWCVGRKGFHQEVIAARAQAGRHPRPGSTAPLRPIAARHVPSTASRSHDRAGRRAAARAQPGRARPPRPGGGRRRTSASSPTPARKTCFSSHGILPGLRDRPPRPSTRACSPSTASTGACPECDGLRAPRVEEDGEERRARGRLPAPAAAPACRPRGAGGEDRRPSHRGPRAAARGRGRAGRPRPPLPGRPPAVAASASGRDPARASTCSTGSGSAT